MPEEKASYALIGILLLVISIFVLAASFIPFWGARVLYVAIPIFFAALVVLVLGIQKKVKVGLLIGTVVLSLIASIISYGQYRAVLKVERWGKRTTERVLGTTVASKTPATAEEQRKQQEEDRNTRARERLLQIKHDAIPCSYMGFVAMDNILWYTSEKRWERLYLFAPTHLFFGEDLSRSNIQNTISRYRKCQRYPKDHKSFDAKAIRMLIGISGSTEYIYEKQVICLARKQAAFGGYYCKLWWNYGLPPTAQQREYLQDIDRIDKIVGKMNEFQKKENSAIIDSLNLMKGKFDSSITLMINAAQRQVTEKYYCAIIRKEVKDTDYDFDKEVLYMEGPKILPLHKNNAQTLTHPIRVTYGYEVAKNEPVYNLYPREYDMLQSEFFTKPEHGRHRFSVPMTKNMASSLFSGGNKTASVTMNAYYSVAWWDRERGYGKGGYRGSGVYLAETFYPRIKLHALEILQGDKLLFDYPMILYQSDSQEEAL